MKLIALMSHITKCQMLNVSADVFVLLFKPLVKSSFEYAGVIWNCHARLIAYILKTYKWKPKN